MRTMFNQKVQVELCESCDAEVVWLETVSGGKQLFDATMRPTVPESRWGQFCIKRSSHAVVDLDNILESRWPAECLHLHRLSCSGHTANARYLCGKRPYLGDPERRGRDDRQQGRVSQPRRWREALDWRPASERAASA